MLDKVCGTPTEHSFNIFLSLFQFTEVPLSFTKYRYMVLAVLTTPHPPTHKAQFSQYYCQKHAKLTVELYSLKVKLVMFHWTHTASLVDLKEATGVYKERSHWTTIVFKKLERYTTSCRSTSYSVIFGQKA